MRIRIEIPEDEINYVAESEYDCGTEWHEHLYKNAKSHFQRDPLCKCFSMGKSYAIKEEA
jgi:hypothetical protein